MPDEGRARDEQTGATMTIPEFAALCREKCTNPAQGHEELGCGSIHEVAGEECFTFCGPHWGVVL